MKGLDREILRLAIPSILANITVPLVGMVDIAVAGHLHAVAGAASGIGPAAYIGGISVGALLLNVIYWNCFFIRASTGGLTAQAFGRRNVDGGEAGSPRRSFLSEPAGGGSVCRGLPCRPDTPGDILRRSLILSGIMAALLLVLQWPLSRLTFIFADATPRVAELALRYFFVRIWAAPATISLMAIKGWFIGMQDSLSSMFTDLIVNVVNIAASIILTLGLTPFAGPTAECWHGIGFDGIALGTVLAQYCGLGFAVAVLVIKYKREFVNVKILSSPSAPQNDSRGFRRLFTLNGDLFVRSLCFTGIYLGYTVIAAQYGEKLLACCNIMMSLLMLFSYFTDGFAYAGEALTGRFIGEKNPEMTKRAVGRTFVWSMGVAGVWMLIYWLAGMPLLRLMTDDPSVVSACSQFLPWLLIMPLFGCAGFTWDGIYIGATSSKAIRNAMIWALGSFLGVWFAGKFLLPALLSGTASPVVGSSFIHLLMAAYFAHLLARAVFLTFRWRRRIL